MKKLINVSDTFKILMIYVITTIVSMVVAGFVVEYDYMLALALLSYTTLNFNTKNYNK